MKTITSIDVQKNNQQRYNIYLDGVFAFGVSEQTLASFGLHKGMTLSTELKERIISDNDFQQIYQKGLIFISYALRTEKQVRDKLLEIPDVNEEVIEQVIQKLKEDKYVDDVFYTQSFIQTALLVTKKGKVLLAKELLQKGVSKEIIKQELLSLDDETELEIALEVAHKYINKQHGLSTRAVYQKTKQHLIQKGYTFSLADKVLSQINIAELSGDEWASLQLQADKIWKRYIIKYEGYELKQKMRSALAQKGFDFDMIKQYIDEKMEESND